MTSITNAGGIFDLQKSLSNTPGFPWAKYSGEYHCPGGYNYLGPGTSLTNRLDSNLQPKSDELPIDAVDKAALSHDIRYLNAEQETDPSKVLDEKHKADSIMIEELEKINPTCFRESFAKWIADKALRLKLKLGMKLGMRINPLTGKPMNPVYSNSVPNLLLNMEILRAKREYEQNPSAYPKNYVAEITQHAENIRKVLGSALNTDDTDTEVKDDELNALVDQFFTEHNKDVKEYNDYKAEEERKAREVSFIERLIEVIEKPMKFITDYTFGQIPFLQDFMTYDKLKGAITQGSKSKWELREEAEALDEAIKSYDAKIDELLKQGHLSSNSPELQKLYDASVPLRKQRREHKKLLGFGLPVLKGIRNKLAEELHSPIVRKFTRRSVFMNALDEIWSADLVFMPDIKTPIKAILTVIDNFSKYAWAIPINTKRNREIIDAFKSIFESSNRKPKKLWTDKGTEFTGLDIKLFFLQNKVHTYSTESELKAVIIERWNRTLKEKMYRKFTENHINHDNYNNHSNWLSILSQVVDEYNNTIHSSHKMTPIEASKPENEAEVKQKLNAKIQKYSSKQPKFEVGDKVRIYSYKSIFDKGYKQNYTDEVFEIESVYPTVPWTYSIKDADGEIITGKFYEKEMVHSDFDFNNKLKVNKVYNF